jgi:RNA polymerase sigma-70 factor (ECF subfamily)
MVRWITWVGGVSDEKIDLESLRNLDPQALSSLHQRNYPEVVRLALYRIGDRMVAEDLASEVFIRLIDALIAGKGPKRNIRGWLLGTMNNLINDHFRSTYRQVVDPLSDESALIFDPVSQIDTRMDSMDDLRGALQRLTEEQQMVIALRFGAEMSLEETASTMGKTANAIKALQFRATAALRKQLEMNSHE